MRINGDMNDCTSKYYRSQYTLISSNNSSEIDYNLPIPINYAGQVSIRLISFFHTLYNVKGSNNTFTYSSDSGANWTTITLSDGFHTIDSINAEIQKSTTNIVIEKNISTLGSRIKLLTATMRVDFNSATSIRSLLGFGAGILTSPINNSPNPVKLMNVTSINVVSNIVQGDGILYTFIPNVQFGERYIDVPVPQYCNTKYRTISKITISLTDQNGVKLDLPNSSLVVRLFITN